MEGGILMLIFLSLTMLLGSFLSGLLPLTLNLTESKMRHITILGAGLLIGTALAVIIPEGINTLYSNEKCLNVNIHDKHEHVNHIHKRAVLSLSDMSPSEFQQKATEMDKAKLRMFLYALSKDSIIRIDKRAIIQQTDEQLLDLFLAEISAGNRNKAVASNLLKRSKTSDSEAQDDEQNDQSMLKSFLTRLDVNAAKKREIMEKFNANGAELDLIKLRRFLYSLSKDSIIRIDKRGVMNLTDEQLLELFLNQISAGNRNKSSNKRTLGDLKTDSSQNDDQILISSIVSKFKIDTVEKRQLLDKFKTDSAELDLVKLRSFMYALSKDSLIRIDKRGIRRSTDEQLLELFLAEISAGNRNKAPVEVSHSFSKRMSLNDEAQLSLFLNTLESDLNANLSRVDDDVAFHRARREADKKPVDEIKLGLKDDPAGKQTGKIDEDLKESSAASAHSAIGVTLILGFVFMLLVDQIGGKFGHRSHQIVDTQSIRNKITFSTTLGLVVHAAADGIALGAAAATSKTDVEMIVFLAIMLHKAPASFGLVSFLIHEGLDRARVRKHLIIFSMAAPLMAILTFIILKSNSTVVSSDSTGLCMLFSAGTFLYVSTVHVLPEVQSHNEDRQFKLGEMFSFIAGALIPLFLTVGHSH